MSSMDAFIIFFIMLRRVCYFFCRVCHFFLSGIIIAVNTDGNSLILLLMYGTGELLMYSTGELLMYSTGEFIMYSTGEFNGD